MKITGIYKINLPPEKDNISVYSYLFCDIHSYNESMLIPEQLNFVSFYLSSNEALETALKEIEDLNADWSHYRVENITQSSIEQSSQLIQILNKAAKFVLSFSYISAFGIMILVTILWMRSHVNETGIYILLGTSRIKIALHYFVEVLLLSLCGSVISLALGFFIIAKFKQDIIQNILALSSVPVIIHNSAESMAMGNSISIRPFINSTVNFTIIVALTTICSTVVVLKYNTRKLFHIN